MLTVTNAFNQRGWSSIDHLIDDKPLQGMIGREYRTLSGLTQAANRLADRNSYPTVEYANSVDGCTYRYRGDANLGIPGRHVPRIERISEPWQAKSGHVQSR